MRNRAALCLLALALVAIGYLLGTRASNANASREEGSSSYRYLTSGNDARELVVWEMQEGRPVTAQIFRAASTIEEVRAALPPPK